MEISIYHRSDTAERIILYSVGEEERRLFEVFAKRIKKGTTRIAVRDDEMFLISGPKEIQALITSDYKVFLENRLKLANSKMKLDFGNQNKLIIDFT